MVLLRDVTELQQLQEERQKVHMMKMLHTYVSHDVMHPIYNILFFIDRMLASGINADIDEMRWFHQLATGSAKQVSSRVKDLLDQTLIEHNNFVPSMV
jgi:K+-sensing histidine kinase KdpD